jgi:hypothetical protein
MAWKFLNIGKAHADIRRLEKLLGVEPLKSWTETAKGRLNIGRANEEIVRLEELVATAPSTISEPPQVPRQSISQSAGASPVGEKFDWNGHTLLALCSGVFGEGHAANIMAAAEQNAWRSSADVARADAGLKDVMERMHAGSSFQKEQMLPEARAAAQRKIDARAGPDIQKAGFDGLRKALFCAGCRVPGLSFAGLAVSRATEVERHPKKIEAAQARVDAFCAVLVGDEFALRSDNAGAKAAAEFLRSQQGGKTLIVGQTYGKNH